MKIETVKTVGKTAVKSIGNEVTNAALLTFGAATTVVLTGCECVGKAIGTAGVIMSLLGDGLESISEYGIESFWDMTKQKLDDMIWENPVIEVALVLDDIKHSETED